MVMSFFDYAQHHADFFTQYGQKVVYKKGQYLVVAIDESPWVFFLQSGTVQASFTLADGDERLLGYFISGTTFAKSGSFFADSGGDIEYRAADTVTAYRIRHDMFFDRLRNDGVFAEEYRSMLLKNQIFLIERIVYQGEKTIERKLLRWLLFMAKYYGTPAGSGCRIAVPTSQHDIANFLHASRVSIGNALQALAATKTISIHQRHITIHDIAAVKSLTE